MERVLVDAVWTADANQEVTGEPDSVDVHAGALSYRHRQHRQGDRNALATKHHLIEVAVPWIVVVVEVTLEADLIHDLLHLSADARDFRKTGDVVGVVKAGGKLYSARQAVTVTVGGCG